MSCLNEKSLEECSGELVSLTLFMRRELTFPGDKFGCVDVCRCSFDGVLSYEFQRRLIIRTYQDPNQQHMYPFAQIGNFSFIHDGMLLPIPLEKYRALEKGKKSVELFVYETTHQSSNTQHSGTNLKHNYLSRHMSDARNDLFNRNLSFSPLLLQPSLLAQATTSNSSLPPITLQNSDKSETSNTQSNSGAEPSDAVLVAFQKEVEKWHRGCQCMGNCILRVYGLFEDVLVLQGVEELFALYYRYPALLDNAIWIDVEIGKNVRSEHYSSGEHGGRCSKNSTNQGYGFGCHCANLCKKCARCRNDLTKQGVESHVDVYQCVIHDVFGVQCAMFQQHPVTVEDLLSSDDSEKVEYFPQYQFLVLNILSLKNDSSYNPNNYDDDDDDESSSEFDHIVGNGKFATPYHVDPSILWNETNTNYGKQFRLGIPASSEHGDNNSNTNNTNNKRMNNAHTLKKKSDDVHHADVELELSTFGTLARRRSSYLQSVEDHINSQLGQSRLQDEISSMRRDYDIAEEDSQQTLRLEEQTMHDLTESSFKVVMFPNFTQSFHRSNLNKYVERVIDNQHGGVAGAVQQDIQASKPQWRVLGRSLGFHNQNEDQDIITEEQEHMSQHSIPQSKRPISLFPKRLELSFRKKVTSGRVLHNCLDYMVDMYQPIVQSLCYSVESLEAIAQRLSMSEHRDQLIRVSLMRKSIAWVTQTLQSKECVLNAQLLTDQKDNHFIDMPYQRDVTDHNTRMIQKLHQAETLLHTLQETYLATVQNEAVLSGEKMNAQMGKLTGVSIIFLPLSLISGIFGMNVFVPMQYGEITEWTNDYWEHLVPFIIICLIMMGIGGGIAMWLKRQKLL